MNWNTIERWLFTATRVSTLIAVLASWFGAGLMFYLGLMHTYEGFAAIAFADGHARGDMPAGDATMVHLIGALDRFLIAVVFLYFGYGLYGLFVRPERTHQELGLPDWLHVDHIGELKQTLAEVILVILFVLFLRMALETFHSEGPNLSLQGAVQLLVLPVSILLLAGALRLAQLHPKSRGARTAGSAADAEPQQTDVK